MNLISSMWTTSSIQSLMSKAARSILGITP